MDTEAALLASIPGDPLAAFALAGYLEERGDSRGELLRLAYTLTREVDVPGRPQMEERLRALLASGIRPVGPYETLTLAPGVDMVFAWVPPGTFLMGSPPDEEQRDESEAQHRVILTEGFYLGVHPVTQAQWRAIMDREFSQFKSNDLPVVNVSRQECRQFCKRLAVRDGGNYRLPTEAEWEYTCRAGTTTPFHTGDTLSTDQANFRGTWRYGKGRKGVYRRRTTPAGRFPPNSWGLCDMHGNVFEYCSDWYGDYPQGEVTNPVGPARGRNRVYRSGSWFFSAASCRAAYRNCGAPGARSVHNGFRLARSFMPVAAKRESVRGDSPVRKRGHSSGAPKR
jgi:formylglycine-generating enzyme required for sulfatase activity